MKRLLFQSLLKPLLFQLTTSKNISPKNRLIFSYIYGIKDNVSKNNKILSAAIEDIQYDDDEVINEDGKSKELTNV